MWISGLNKLKIARNVDLIGFISARYSKAKLWITVDNLCGKPLNTKDYPQSGVDMLWKTCG